MIDRRDDPTSIEARLQRAARGIRDLTEIDRIDNDRLKARKVAVETPHPFDRSEFDANLCAHCGNGPNVTWHTENATTAS